jgi:hypothetical protein
MAVIVQVYVIDWIVSYLNIVNQLLNVESAQWRAELVFALVCLKILIEKSDIIHPVWLIEEYGIWLRSPIDATITDTVYPRYPSLFP